MIRISQRPRSHSSPTTGFTLVEMLVVAPIVILLISGFIALIVNVTGEVLASRASNVLSYNVQDALNRIERDVKMSSAFLAVNDIDISTTKQGYGGTVSTGSTVNFTNVDKTSSSGSPASLILRAAATTRNPLNASVSDNDLVYLAGSPNACTTYATYSSNTPMFTNIVYFVQDNALWRRTIMPVNYNNPSVRCGDAPWQVPSCIEGYTSALTFCQTNDEKIIVGVSSTNFVMQYFANSSTTTSDTASVNSGSTDATRNAALANTPSVNVTITANQTVAGRDISRTASMRVTRATSNL